VSNRRKNPTVQRSAPAAPQRRLPIGLIIGAVVAVVLVVTIVLTFGESDESPLEVGSPSITGQALPTYDQAGTDTAVGQPIPSVTGADWNDTAVSITDDGRAKILVFLAHWCPVCQDEVPVITSWLAAGLLPEGVDMYTVATGISRVRDNYPPSAWLEREGWEPPVMLDDQQNSVAAAFGLPAYPYFVFVNADGTVAGRITGRLGGDQLTAFAQSLVVQ
jgi:thiol-disulfide isomerase/thioredoxin